VTDIARQYPIPIISALLGAKPQDWQLFSDWTDDIFKAFTWNAAERPELAAGAVEETMRHSPITFATFRAAIEDVELAGVRIPAGTMVIANTGAANRDPAVYTDPDVLDITRTGAPALLTFGGGMHYCLGAHLARLELAEALTVMTRRMPNARRTGPAPWKPLTGLSGPHTLPIEFDPGY
jgi:cytochrome P450